MQPPTGQFVYINGGSALQQPMSQNVVATPQQQLQYVVVVPAQKQVLTSLGAYGNYRKKISKVMGSMQIIMAAFLVGLNIGLAVIDYNYMWVISTGWWATPFIVIAGAFGIVAGAHPNNCTVITTMVFSILSCACVISIITQGALSIAAGCDDFDWYYYYCIKGHQETPNIIMSSFFIIFGIAEFAFALVQSILCCQGCCRRNPTVQANQFSSAHARYKNGGFVPCYMHPEAQPQSTSFLPGAQAFQVLPQGGASGQNALMTSAQNVVMSTAQEGDTTEEATVVQPPPYNLK